MNGEHLTIEGLEKLKTLAKKMNTKVNITPEWVSGFVEGEGCFHIFRYFGKQTLKGKTSSTWLLNPSSFEK